MLVWGLAVVVAVAVHAGVVRMLWWPQVSVAPHAAVIVQLIERPQPAIERPQPAPAEAPPVAARPVPQPPAAVAPKPRHPAAQAAAKHPVPVKPKPALQAESKLAPAPQLRPAGQPQPALAPTSEPQPSASVPVAAAAPPAVAMAPLPEPELAVQCQHRPPPVYPAAARRRGQEGVVELRVNLSATGAVTRVTVARSSGASALDQAAVAAVRNWRCEPARAGGVAVPAAAVQRIRFSLR